MTPPNDAHTPYLDSDDFPPDQRPEDSPAESMLSTERGHAPQPVTASESPHNDGTRPSLVCGPPDEIREGASGPDSMNEVLPPGTGGGNAGNWCAEGLRADRASGDVGGRASQTATSTPQMLPQHSENDYARPKGRQHRRKLGSGTEGAVELRISLSTGEFVAVKFPKGGHNLCREADAAG